MPFLLTEDNVSNLAILSIYALKLNKEWDLGSRAVLFTYKVLRGTLSSKAGMNNQPTNQTQPFGLSINFTTRQQSNGFTSDSSIGQRW